MRPTHSPNHSRAKGKRGELELRDFLRSFGWEARRGQQYCGNPNAPDIIHNIPFLHIECKRVNRLDLRKYMQQAIADAGKERFPSVWHRADKEEWYMTMKASDFLKIMNLLRHPVPLGPQHLND